MKTIVRPVPGVAVDFDECTGRVWGGRHKHCRCGVCTVCGNQKHCGLHGGLYGESKGGQPYHHEFQPASAEKGEG